MNSFVKCQKDGLIGSKEKRTNWRVSYNEEGKEYNHQIKISQLLIINPFEFLMLHYFLLGLYEGNTVSTLIP